MMLLADAEINIEMKKTTKDAMHLCCREGFVRAASNCATSMFSGTLIINGDCNFIMYITK